MDDEPDIDDGLLQALDGMSKIVDTLTGVRQQFLNQGWNAEVAEKMVLNLMDVSTAQARLIAEKEIAALQHRDSAYFSWLSRP